MANNHPEEPGRNKKRAWQWLAILVVMFLMAGTTALEKKGYASAGSIRWLSFENGMSLGKTSEKKMIIHFYADWCTYCEKMDKETFRDRKVADYLNKEFIPIRVNSDRRSNIASNYGVKGLPSTWFVDEDGRRISNLPGYIPPDMFLNILRYVHSDSYKSMSFNKFLKSM